MKEIIYKQEEIKFEDKPCPKCNEKQLEYTEIPCPDGMRGCIVRHMGYYCHNCKTYFR